jgi:hypothetical protein
LKEDSFLGEWYAIKGEAEAYSFLKDNGNYIFTGTIHYSPVFYGTWKIDRDKFVFIMDNGTVASYTFSLSNDTLVFNDGQEIYTKTPPLEVQFPEVRILNDLASDFGSHKFSEPRPVDINWGLWVDSTKSSKELLLKGFTVSMGSLLLSDDIENLSGYLVDHGFTKDTLYLTEICNGFWDGNQLVTICASPDPGSANDSLNIIVSSAFIK